MKRLLLLPALLLASASWAAASNEMTVHEWGTFTSLQDEQGNSIGGINTDDEPLPDFVHRIADLLMLPRTEAPPVFFQGAPSCHPDVTMRLETPVIYFHPPPGWKPEPVGVHVSFPNGWLTEYYPDAIFRAPGLDGRNPKQVVSNTPEYVGYWPHFGHLPTNSSGELSWKSLSLGAQGKGPETDAKVWLAPRAVDAARVRTAAGECENFLFYRGVAHADAPLRIVRTEDSLEIHYNPDIAMPNPERTLRIPAAWLVEVNSDGVCAFRPLGPVEWGSTIRASAPTSFAANDFQPANLSRLQGEMRSALIAVGLFPDEADALLNTWQISYFKSPGTRLFYVCPRNEVNSLLPLELSIPAHLVRAMIGRIEIVTPEQRALLAKIAAGPAPDLGAMRGATGDINSEFFKHPENVANWNAVMVGNAPLNVLGLQIPELYRDYLKLGRFRNALLLDEEKRRPTPALEEFISKNRFQAYTFK